jgi:hypothetical protein
MWKRKITYWIFQSFEIAYLGLRPQHAIGKDFILLYVHVA